MELSEAEVALRHNGGPEFEEPGFVFNPGLGQFLENLDRYLQEVPIEWHLRPLHQHLPQGLDQFTRVHQIKRIDLLQDHLSEIYGKALGLPRLQTRGEKVSIKQLSSSQLEQVFNFCQTDYELLSGWFTRDEVWNQWKSDQDAWVYNSDARRLEDALRLSRTPEDLIIGDFESKSIALCDLLYGARKIQIRSLIGPRLAKGRRITVAYRFKLPMMTMTKNSGNISQLNLVTG